jgi:hypothetical protein
MLLEYLRRNNDDFAGFLKTYLFTEEPILQIEHEQEAGGDGATTGERAPRKPAPR